MPNIRAIDMMQHSLRASNFDLGSRPLFLYAVPRRLGHRLHDRNFTFLLYLPKEKGKSVRFPSAKQFFKPI